MNIWLADLISLSRVILAYPLYCSMLSEYHVFTIVLVCWMIVSDMLDGLVARHFGSSELGKWLDPIADAVGVAAWVSGLLQMHIIGWHWIAFWVVRYLFFMCWALWIRFRYRYYIAAGVWNKISIIFLMVFIFSAWWRGAVAPEFGFVLFICQILSIWEAMMASPKYGNQNQI